MCRRCGQIPLEVSTAGDFEIILHEALQLSYPETPGVCACWVRATPRDLVPRNLPGGSNPSSMSQGRERFQGDSSARSDGLKRTFNPTNLTVRSCGSQGVRSALPTDILPVLHYQAYLQSLSRRARGLSAPFGGVIYRRFFPRIRCGHRGGSILNIPRL